jgi:hypothetical protein
MLTNVLSRDRCTFSHAPATAPLFSTGDVSSDIKKAFLSPIFDFYRDKEDLD